MGALGTLLKHPDEIVALIKLKKAALDASNHIPSDAHLAFCYTMLQKVSRSFTIVIQQLGQELRDAVETVADYDEYCHYVAGLVGLGLSSLFYAANLEELAPENLSNSMGLFLQKTNIIRDYLEDINELPKPRMFWPKEIWGKYVSKLEDFKDENNADLAVACLNELIANALEHVLDCLKYMSALRNSANFRFCAIPQIMAIGTLAACYNNVEVFRGVVKIRRGLTAKIMDRTRSMDDVYGAFFEFSNMLIAKIEGAQNGEMALKHAKAIQEACQSSGSLSRRRTLTLDSSICHELILVIALLILLIAMLFVVKK